MEKKDVKKTLINLAIFVVLICITFYVLFKNQDLDDIVSIILNIKVEYVILGAFCMFIYLLLEGLNIKRTLRKLGDKITIKNAIKYSYIGFFFSSITPAATGGQPMQAYFMNKDKLKLSNSTLALLINLVSFQIVTLVLSFVGIIISSEYLKSTILYFYILGLILNIPALLFILLSIFSKGIAIKIISFAIAFMKKIKIPNMDKKQQKIEKGMENYSKSVEYIKENKNVMIKTILITLIQVIVYYMIPYTIYRAFGFSNIGIIKIISIQSILYIAVCAIPLPGAVGVSESGFSIIFKEVFGANIVNSAMLVNRGISFYIYVIISGLVVLISFLKLNKESNTKDKELIDDTINKGEV